MLIIPQKTDKITRSWCQYRKKTENKSVNIIIDGFGFSDVTVWCFSLSHLTENWWWIGFRLRVSKQHSMFAVSKAHVNYNGHIALFNSVSTSQPHLRLFAETSSDHLNRITRHSHTLILYLWLVLCNQGNVASRWRGHPAVLHEILWLLVFEFQFISSGSRFRHNIT